MRKTLLLIFSVCGLAACEANWNPSYAPSGYAYHQNEYKSPPGDRAMDIGYDYDKERNHEYMEIWRVVVRDLIENMEKTTGLSPQTVYIDHVPVNDAFTNSYDHVLRKELRSKGYILTKNESHPVHIRYDAYMPLDYEEIYGRALNEALEHQTDMELADFLLVLTVREPGKHQKQVASVYKLPDFGYDRNLDDAPKAELFLGAGR